MASRRLRASRRRRARGRLRPPLVDVRRASGVPSGRARLVAGGCAAGDRVLRAAGRWLRARAGRPPDPSADRRLGLALVAGGLFGVVAGPVVGGLTAAVAVAVPVVRARAARQRRQAAVVGGLPDVIDLLRIGVDAGLDVGGALRAVVDSGSGPDDTDEDELVSVLARVRQRADRGDLLVDALTELRALGEPARALYEGLVAAQRDGVPLLPALERAGTDARDRRRRQREEAARQLPVKLLFPLVFCTLPALVLLTVVPLLARSLPSLTPEVVGPFERQPVAPVTTPGPRGVHPCCR